MRIEAPRILVAVVLLSALACPRLAAANNITLSLPSRRPREHSPLGNNSQWERQQGETGNRSGALTYREIQSLLRREGGERGGPVDCCPTVEELVEPRGGRNRDELYVELYRDGDNKQVFYEYSCRPDVLDKPCRFIDRKLANQSRCVQKFSYSYALVRDPRSSSTMHRKESNEEQHRHRHGRTPDSVLSNLSTFATPGNKWSLDYIRVRSGCSCELLPKQKRRKKQQPQQQPKPRSKWRKTREPESDWEI